MNKTSVLKPPEIKIIIRNRIKADNRIKINSSAIAFKNLLEIWDMDTIELMEQSKIILLDRQLRMIGISHISTGGTNMCICDPKIVFAVALKSRASSIILAHNHIYGDTEPSRADFLYTTNIAASGKILDIDILDHLIISKHKYYSFRDNDVMPKIEE